MLALLAGCGPAEPPPPLRFEAMRHLLRDMELIEARYQRLEPQPYRRDSLARHAYARLLRRHRLSEGQFWQAWNYYSARPRLMLQVQDSVATDLATAQAQLPPQARLLPTPEAPPVNPPIPGYPDFQRRPARKTRFAPCPAPLHRAGMKPDTQPLAPPETVPPDPAPLRLLPADLLEKLEFPRLRERLVGHCLGEEAKAQARALVPLAEAAAIERLLLQGHEMLELLNQDEVLPFSHVPHVAPYLLQAQPEGSFLEAEAFFRLRLWLLTVRKLKSYLQHRQERCPTLAALLVYARSPTDFTERIEAIIGADGQVRTQASPQLARIREAQIVQGEALRRLLDRILRQARSQGWADDKELTIRNDRLVIPILADFRGKVEGFVQDVSASGRTLFVEPVEALQLNNEIRSLQLQERSEIVRILTRLTDELRPLLPGFRALVRFVTELDLARARGRLAQELGGALPARQPRFRQLHLLEARHPLLVLQKGAASVVPISFTLQAAQPLLIISGPNAGGKTVALQTAALCQLMLQAGLLPPLSADSSLPIFRTLILDMGDNQSIQNNLSTYSSHLVLMQQMLQVLDTDCLYLLDEFGDGTDPLLGGAIAEALLERFVLSRAAGVITTHYANLKEFAQHSPVVSNASMEFDLGTLAPTYRLRQGLPGSSYALEIAQRVGLPSELLESARQKVGRNRSEAETLLVQLRGQEAELRRQLEAVRTQEQRLQEQARELKESLQRSEQRRKDILQEARLEAAQLLKEANRKIEQTIREIRERQAERLRTQALRRQLAQALPLPEDQAAPEPEATAGPVLIDDPRTPLRAGDRVRLQDTETLGELLALEGDEALVAFGQLQARVDPARLVRVTEAPPTPELSPAMARFSAQQLTRTAELRPSLDLRGQRVETALTHLDRYLDQALLSSMTQTEIIHGKGSGTLRKAIREHLQARLGDRIQLRDGEEPGRGNGVTVLTFR